MPSPARRRPSRSRRSSSSRPGAAARLVSRPVTSRSGARHTGSKKRKRKKEKRRVAGEREEKKRKESLSLSFSSVSPPGRPSLSFLPVSSLPSSLRPSLFRASENGSHAVVCACVCLSYPSFFFPSSSPKREKGGTGEREPSSSSERLAHSFSLFLLFPFQTAAEKTRINITSIIQKKERAKSEVSTDIYYAKEKDVRF